MEVCYIAEPSGRPCWMSDWWGNINEQDGIKRARISRLKVYWTAGVHSFDIKELSRMLSGQRSVFQRDVRWF